MRAAVLAHLAAVLPLAAACGGTPSSDRPAPRADARCADDAGLAATYRSIGGREMDDESKRCTRRSTTFPGVIALGVFGHDRGCAVEGLLIDCAYHETWDGAAILARAGWKDAGPDRRVELARAYLAEVAVVHNLDAEPSARARPDGTIEASVGVTIVGMRGPSSWREVFRFTPAGQVTEVEAAAPVEPEPEPSVGSPGE